MSQIHSSLAGLNVSGISFPSKFQPVEKTVADEFAALTGAPAKPSARPGKGRVNIALASRKWAPAAQKAAKDATNWMWLRIDENGAGEIIASEGSGIFAAGRLLAHGLTGTTREKLAAGILIERSFSMNKPIWDGSFAQYWHNNRKFCPDQYAETLAQSGFTHIESTACRRASHTKTPCPANITRSSTRIAPGSITSSTPRSPVGSGQPNTSTPISNACETSPRSVANTGSNPACASTNHAVCRSAFSKNTPPSAAPASTIHSARVSPATRWRRITPSRNITSNSPPRN